MVRRRPWWPWRRHYPPPAGSSRPAQEPLPAATNPDPGGANQNPHRSVSPERSVSIDDIVDAIRYERQQRE
ncbi:MAG: hypothetical protein ACT4OS_00170 [Acidimicrobiales bacterium]